MLAAACAWAAPAPPPQGFFALYSANRTDGVPNYITEDFLVLTYGMMVDNAVTRYEEQTALPALTALLDGLAASPAAAADSPEAKANRLFLEVLQALASGKTPASAEAQAEVAAVRAAAGIQPSKLMRQTLDYSQFKPRGKYTRSDALKNYFAASRYANTVLFFAADSKSTGVAPADADFLTRQALLLAKAIHSTPELAKQYAALTTALDYLFGKPDDLTVEDLKPHFENADAVAVRTALLGLHKHPAIYSGVVDLSKLEPKRTPAEVLTGWRLLPSRFSPDAAAFQELVFPNLQGKFTGSAAAFTAGEVNGKKVKTFPRGLEVFALLDVPSAAAKLKAGNDQAYEGYGEAAKKASARIKTESGLSSAQLAALAKWATAADSPRRLNTALSAWTWQRYASLLYAKQSTTLSPKSIQLTKDRSIAYIEPATELYEELSKLATQVSKTTGDQPLQMFAAELTRCAGLAKKADPKKPFDGADAAYLNELDRKLQSLTGRPDLPIVADVHTDLNSQQILEEGLARPTIATHTAGDAALRGALFTYVEFKQPLQKRLTDEEWQRDPRSTPAPTAAPSGGGAPSDLVSASGVALPPATKVGTEANAPGFSGGKVPDNTLGPPTPVNPPAAADTPTAQTPAPKPAEKKKLLGIFGGKKAADKDKEKKQ